MSDAKEKAQELVDKFYQTTPYEAWYNPPLESLSMEYKAWEQAKQCAIIAVDEILDDDVYDMSEELFDNRIEYWQEVKQEIEKL